MSLKSNRLLRYLRLFARIVSFLASAFFLLIFIGEGIPDLINKSINPKLLPFLPLLLIAIIGCFITLFKEIIGGILQITGGVGMSIYLLVIGGMKDLDIALVFGLPYLICGVISLIYGWKCRINKEKEDKS